MDHSVQVGFQGLRALLQQHFLQNPTGTTGILQGTVQKPLNSRVILSKIAIKLF